MKSFSHLKLGILPGEFKYVLFDNHATFLNFIDEAKHAKPAKPISIFCTADEMSAIVPAEMNTHCEKEVIGWFGMRILGEMPFGTVQGLIAEISGKLRDAGIGVCVVSTFKTDLFFIKCANRAKAIDALKITGWGIVA